MSVQSRADKMGAKIVSLERMMKEIKDKYEQKEEVE